MSGLVVLVFGYMFVLRGFCVEGKLFLLCWLPFFLFVDLAVPVKIVNFLNQFYQTVKWNFFRVDVQLDRWVKGFKFCERVKLDCF